MESVMSPLGISADPLDRETIGESLTSHCIGRILYCFDVLPSTSTLAYELALGGAPEGAAVVAERQTAGRGRRGRSWFSPPGTNIYTSIVLRPAIEPVHASQLTLVAAVALAHAVTGILEEPVGKRGEIKWPNDILVGGRKCGGILTEMRLDGKRIDFVILGIGLNVNLQREAVPEEFREGVTSLREEAGRYLQREPIVGKIYEALEFWYERYLSDGFGAIAPAWEALFAMKGRKVKVAVSAPLQEGASPVADCEEGIALGIDGSGALLLERETGEVARIFAGDLLPGL